MSLLRGITDVIVGISNQKICYFLLYPLFQQRTQSQNQPMMRIKLMKGNLSRVSGPVALARSKLQISVFPRSCGIRKP